MAEDKQVGKSSFETVSLEKVSWEDSWSADRKSSFDDDKKSLDVSDFKAEMKEFV